MTWARLASVLGIIAGALASPLSFSAGYVGELTEDQAKQLDEQAKRMAPAPYVPGNAPGCERWKGRAVIVSPTPDRLCSSGCALEIEDEWGNSSRWVVTGKRCERRVVQPSQARQEAPGSTQAVAASQSPPVAERLALPRYEAPKPGPGEAKNHGPGQQIIEGPPVGERAARRPLRR